ncbi:unnamed protein product [Musa acuminata subsp. malaccensis]|uniref:(wild Malaysian banana) hypothetical protein n=1 Tax=Musa acuminata subsp. malaccensis TaxID=214687 RepID=A0A804IJR2_MUSAM|nr:PREDICTED: serine/arginine repetitive matrix protein 1-like [Musa acuminata subsp. malaccensis]CAG1840864.1 unnamed protein product [Musa acuminata subsp. malaccensis]
MASGAGRGLVDRKHFERQMGCMAGFLNLFDRHQILARKRLPPAPAAGSALPKERSRASAAAFAKERRPSPSLERHSPAEIPSIPYPRPVFEVTDEARSSWKLREAPPLSLNSRAMADAKGKLRRREIRTASPTASPSNHSDSSAAADESEKQRRGPSVVARLMGLEALPDPASAFEDESDRLVLRRSASESRVPRDPSYYQFLDVGSFPKAPPVETSHLGDIRLSDAKKSKSPARNLLLPPLQRKRFFDAEDFFPVTKRWVLLPSELEKRSLMRGMDEAARDLETLKQILEALQLKGLLHSKPPDYRINGGRDHIDDHLTDISPIVVIEPAPTPPQRPLSEPRPPLLRRPGNGRRNAAAETAAQPVPRNRTVDRIPTGSKSSSARQRISNSIESGKSRSPSQRISTVDPRKTPPNRLGPSPLAGRPPPNLRPKQEVVSKPRIRSPVPEDVSATTSPLERSWAEDHREGRQLLERCDRLLHCIAAFTAAEQDAEAVEQNPSLAVSVEQNPSLAVSVAQNPSLAVAVEQKPSLAVAAEQQPSPVSILDSSLLGEGNSPRSPVSKRSIDFEGDQLAELEEETTGCNLAAEDDDDDDYAYVAKVLRASDIHGDSPDVYALLEKQRRSPSGPSEAARLHRRLVFDAVAEILEQKRCATRPPWEAIARPGSLSSTTAAVDGGTSLLLLPEVWAELEWIREQAPADDLNDATCWAVRRDLVRESLDGWARPAAEVADAVIHIERQIFKNLVADTIRHLADAHCAAAAAKPRRLKLVC